MTTVIILHVETVYPLPLVPLCVSGFTFPSHHLALPGLADSYMSMLWEDQSPFKSLFHFIFIAHSYTVFLSEYKFSKEQSSLFPILLFPPFVSGSLCLALATGSHYNIELLSTFHCHRRQSHWGSRREKLLLSLQAFVIAYWTWKFRRFLLIPRVYNNCIVNYYKHRVKTNRDFRLVS